MGVVDWVVDKVKDTATQIKDWGNAALNYLGDFGGTLVKTFGAAAGEFAEALKKLNIKRLDDSLLRLGKALLDLHLAPVLAGTVCAYWGYLRTDAEGKWFGTFPSVIALAVQPYLPKVNLAAVKIAQNVDTLTGYSVTFENEIFLNCESRIDTWNGLHLLLHELCHVDQYRREGGSTPFIAKYAVQVAREVLEHHTFSPHDLMNLEHEAKEFADRTTDLVVCKIGLANRDNSIPALFVFDPDFYIKAHSDVCQAADAGFDRRSSGILGAALRNMPAARDVSRRRFAVLHWLNYGIREGRKSSSDFDVRNYVDNYENLKRIYGQNWLAAIDHYILYGPNEGRKNTV